jgi:hypothetical protein
VAAGRQSGAEARQSDEAAVRARTPRPSDQTSRRTEPGGPAFISDQAEEQYHLDQLHDPLTDPLTRSTARIELARLFERRGQFSEAAEMYERNVWAGVRTPATYAGLASAYRQLGRNDLADAALEQVRRGGGAPLASREGTEATAVLPATRPAPRTSERGSSARRSAQRMGSLQPRASAVRESAVAADAPRAGRRTATPSFDFAAKVRELVAPIMANEIGRRTVFASSVLLPIAVGVAIFATVVMTSTRSRASEPVPTPAPVATIAPTAAPAATAAPVAPASLSQPPAAARLVVNNVGPDGLTLRRSPGIGEKIKVWNDGTEMADLGDTAEHSGRTWRKVRDPNGNVGWAAADFLIDPASAGPSAATTTTNLSTGARTTPASPPFASGGLGLSRAEWETTNGQPTRSSIFLEYANGKLVVGLLEGNVWHLERAWNRNEPVALDAAREEARAYLVSDAVLVQSVDRGDGRIVDVYSSALLGSRFGPTAWNGGRAGTFSIQYRFRTAADRMVTSAMFRLGDVLF